MADHPLAHRLALFRELATEARDSASHASSPEHKEGFEHLAESWEQLIHEIETAMMQTTQDAR